MTSRDKRKAFQKEVGWRNGDDQISENLQKKRYDTSKKGRKSGKTSKIYDISEQASPTIKAMQKNFGV